jgi:peptide/nickel transport system substrate-binding protein
LDLLTVRCRLPVPFAPFLSFATIGILPKGELADVDVGALFDHPFNRAPIGSGPFRLVGLDETRAVLERNPSYYLGASHIREVVFRFYPDEHAALTALHRQEILGLLVSPRAGGDDVDVLTGEGDLRLYSANGTAYTVLYLNDDSPLFGDRRLRKAVALAIDRGAIVSGFLAGRALRADSPVPPGTWATDPTVEALPHDPTKARQLLEEAGWRQQGAALVRRRAGAELRFPLLTDTDPLRVAIAEEIARQLMEVGIRATVTPLGASELIRDSLLPADYEAAIFGWDPGNDPDPYSAWHSSQTVAPGRNLANYASAEADAILEEARTTTDLNERQALYYRFQRLFLADVPSVPLYYPIHNYFVDKSVRGVALGTFFDTAVRFNNVREWTIVTEEGLIGP